MSKLASIDTLLGAAPDVVENELEEGVALLNLRTGECCDLDPIGAEVWSLLRRGASLRSAVEHIVSLYEVSTSRAQADVLDLVEALDELGMVSRGSSTSDA